MVVFIAKITLNHDFREWFFTNAVCRRRVQAFLLITFAQFVEALNFFHRCLSVNFVLQWHEEIAPNRATTACTYHSFWVILIAGENFGDGVIEQADGFVDRRVTGRAFGCLPFLRQSFGRHIHAWGDHLDTDGVW